MVKYSSNLYVQDLINAIRNDFTLLPLEKEKLIDYILSKASPLTPLNVLLRIGIGGLIGNLIAKYFGLGTFGRVVGTLAGASAGLNFENILRSL